MAGARAVGTRSAPCVATAPSQRITRHTGPFGAREDRREDRAWCGADSRETEGGERSVSRMCTAAAEPLSRVNLVSSEEMCERNRSGGLQSLICTNTSRSLGHRRRSEKSHMCLYAAFLGCHASGYWANVKRVTCLNLCMKRDVRPSGVNSKVLTFVSLRSLHRKVSCAVQRTHSVSDISELRTRRPISTCGSPRVRPRPRHGRSWRRSRAPPRRLRRAPASRARRQRAPRARTCQRGTGVRTP